MRDTISKILVDRRFWPCCFSVFLLIRLFVLIAIPVVPTSDAEWYVHRGLEIAAGEGYHEGPWATAFWPVGFPAYLGAIFFLVGPHLMAAKMMNLFLSCGIFFLTYRVAIRMLNDALAARIALILLTFYPNQIAYTGVLLSEMLCTFVLLVGIQLFMGKPGYLRNFLSGVVFGLETLIKAQFLFVPLILLTFYGLLVRHQPRFVRNLAISGTIVALGMACVILPWTARNYLVFHRMILVSTNGGAVFLGANNPQAWINGDAVNSPLMARARFSVADQVNASRRAYDLALDWLRHEPAYFVERIPIKAWWLWIQDGEGEWWYQRGFSGYASQVPAFRAARIFNQLYYIALLLTGTAGIWRVFRERNDKGGWALIGVALGIYVTLVSIIYSGQSRYHAPMVPFMCVYSGVFLANKLRASTRALVHSHLTRVTASTSSNEIAEAQNRPLQTGFRQ